MLGNYFSVGVMQEDGFLDYSALLHCAVYMLVRRGKVVYVGQSKTVHSRLSTHCSTRGKKPAKKSYYGTSIYKGMMFDEILVRPCMLGELADLEARMIKKYEPKYNVYHKPGPPPMALGMLIDMMPTVMAQQPKPVESQWRRR